jgi:tRNA A-37 threonylcarbamoyl transferase component Bud32
MQPTVIYQPSLSETTESSVDVSQAHVGVVAGGSPHFSHETADLLRRRLSAAALVLSVALAAAFIGNLISEVTALWELRAVILLATSGATVVLRTRPSLSLRCLKTLELVVFGSVVIQLSLMPVTNLARFASNLDATSMASMRQQSLMAWCILIFIYGILIPNTWTRAAIITLCTALIPYLVIALQKSLSPEVYALLEADHATSALPLPVVAAVIATYASYVIATARREVFKARKFGQYRLMESIGVGGMGEVYKTEHLMLKRPCAIKLIKQSSQADLTAIKRFEKEVKTTARLTHWNTVEIYDYGHTDDGTFYYVMELLPGMSLEDLVERHGPLPPERAVYLLRQICAALPEAHHVGMIHRDIKPANIFASSRGGQFDVAKLLDFGLVKEDTDASRDGTTSTSFCGTPLYMSPEQALSYDAVDARADIYSLGAVAYYLLTGETPFSGGKVLELLAAHRNAEVIPPSRLNSVVPTDLDQIILKCMAKKPSDRFQDADELRHAFEKCSAGNRWGAEDAATWWRSLPTTRAEVGSDG